MELDTFKVKTCVYLALVVSLWLFVDWVDSVDWSLALSLLLQGGL